MAKPRSMAKHKLIVTTDDIGETGLALANVLVPDMPMVDTDGYSIAHDVVEHINGPAYIGEIQDELTALGAIWYVRGQWGDLRRDGSGVRHSPEQHLAADVARMFEEYCNGVPLRQKSPALPTTRAGDIEDVIDTVLLEAKLHEVDGSTGLKRVLYKALVRDAMRTGYRKAKRKYEAHGRGRFFANNLFWNIQDCVARFHKHHELIEGAHLYLQLKGEEATILYDETDDYY